MVTFVGVPGSGKTTFGKELAKQLGAVFLNNDAIRLSMWGSHEAVLATHETKQARVHANALTYGALDYATAQAMHAGYSVVYDCNANKKVDRANMERIAREAGGMSIVVRIRTPELLAIERAQQRRLTNEYLRMKPEKAEEVVMRFAREIQEPDDDERVIEISGEIPFQQQYDLFSKKLAEFSIVQC